MPSTLSILTVLVALSAIFIHYDSLMNGASPDHPYFTSSAAALFFPVGLLYYGITNLMFIGSDMVNPLPLPTPQNTNKIAIITGANTGIGYATARTLVHHYGWQVILACRSKEKAIRAMVRINEDRTDLEAGEAIVLEDTLDLSSFGSVQLFADEVRRKYDKVDVLINNAGRNTSGKSGRLNLLFQSNFLGHFLLTSELMEPLQHAKGRVVNLASVMHHFVGTEELNEDYWKSVALWDENVGNKEGTYAASKLAAILFTNELIRRFGNSIQSTAVNPGAATSDIWRGFPEWTRNAMGLIFLTTEEASVPVVAAAVDDWDLNATYIQPYWQYDFSKTPHPASEMFGPYVGYSRTAPRLGNDGGMKAGASLWKVSEGLVRPQR